MSRQFDGDEKSKYVEITKMWDNMLKPPEDGHVVHNLKEAKDKIQIFINVAIDRSVAQINDALDTIERYSNSEKYSKIGSRLFAPVPKAEQESIMIAQRKIITSSLIPLIHFTEYAKSHGITNEEEQYKPMLDPLLKRVAKVMPDLINNKPREDRKPSLT